MMMTKKLLAREQITTMMTKKRTRKMIHAL